MELGTQGELILNEPRFVEDDLSQLCNLGLLIPDHNSKGERLFRFTRAAALILNKASKL